MGTILSLLPTDMLGTKKDLPWADTIEQYCTAAQATCVEEYDADSFFNSASNTTVATQPPAQQQFRKLSPLSLKEVRPLVAALLSERRRDRHDSRTALRYRPDRKVREVLPFNFAWVW